MQSLTSNIITNNYLKNNFGKLFKNSIGNSFNNLNFSYNYCPNHFNHLTEKRNLHLQTNFSSCKNIINFSNEIGISNVIQTSTFLSISEQQNFKNFPRFFSKTNFNLDKNTSNSENNKVKIDTEKFLIGFTCKKCNKRSYKLISKKSYYEGVVIIRCDQCKNLHLIADHLGWYDSMNKFGTIEDYFKRQKNGTTDKTVIRKDLKQLTQTEQNDVIEFLKEEQKELEEEKKK